MPRSKMERFSCKQAEDQLRIRAERMFAKVSDRYVTESGVLKARVWWGDGATQLWYYDSKQHRWRIA